MSWHRDGSHCESPALCAKLGHGLTNAALDDRRQRAREAYWDTDSAGNHERDSCEAAIETATRVQITREILTAGQWAVPGYISETEARKMIKAAFEAAGFEVEP